MRPRTEYAKNNGVNIAYQVVGDGPIDLLVVPGFVSNVDFSWTHPAHAAFYKALASFSRLIIHDKRGTGLSDPVVGIPPLEQRMEDIHAVLDAVGSESAALFGISEGGPMSVLFAATYPERTRALVLYGTFARGTRSEGHEGAMTADALELVIDSVDNHWGDGSTFNLFMPSLAPAGEREREWLGVAERAAASPALAKATLEAVLEIDVTPALKALHVPTLVLHRTGDIIPISGGRYIADHVDGARFVELPGNDHAYHLGDWPRVVNEIERFLTGAAGSARSDRLLATLLFTDIVGSTDMAARIGDAGWRETLDHHDSLVRSHLARFDGAELKHTGDGFLARFAGPARAIRCASAIIDDIPRELSVEVRAGIHTGECEVLGDDIAGVAVHLAARVCAVAGTSEIFVTGTVRDLVAGSEIEFEDAGTRELKGIPGTWPLLRVRDPARDSIVGTPRTPDPLGKQERRFLAAAKHAPWLLRLASRFQR